MHWLCIYSVISFGTGVAEEIGKRETKYRYNISSCKQTGCIGGSGSPGWFLEQLLGNSKVQPLLIRLSLQLKQIRGELYNLQGPLNLSSDQRPRFVRLCFYDPSYAAQACSTANPNIKETLLRSIMEELKEILDG